MTITFVLIIIIIIIVIFIFTFNIYSILLFTILFIIVNIIIMICHSFYHYHFCHQYVYHHHCLHHHTHISYPLNTFSDWKSDRLDLLPHWLMAGGPGVMNKKYLLLSLLKNDGVQRLWGYKRKMSGFCSSVETLLPIYLNVEVICFYQNHAVSNGVLCLVLWDSW